MTRAMLLAAVLWAAVPLAAQPKRVLFVTHSAGFRHDSILVARQVLPNLDPSRLAVTATEDLSLLAADRLRDFDAVFFFTSGELAISDAQKRDLLDFVRSGKGFGGAHSATDTLYGWAEYGDLIGGYFDGHPWVHNVRVDVEDPDNPLVRHLGSSFEIVEEIYQHRNFDRDRVRVLMTLDTTSVNLGLEGVNRTDRDFALAWMRNYGQGRVFYTAFGHFDETWRDARFQEMLKNALLWMTGQIEAAAIPRGGSPGAAPKISAAVEAAQFGFPAELAAGAFVSVFGSNLSTGATMAEANRDRLAGVRASWNGFPLRVWYASPGQVNVLVPNAAGPVGMEGELRITAGNQSGTLPVKLSAATPGIFAVTTQANAMVLWCGGLGAVGIDGLVTSPMTVNVGGLRADVFYAGLAPGFIGLYQVNVVRPAGAMAGPAEVELLVGGKSAKRGVSLP